MAGLIIWNKFIPREDLLRMIDKFDESELPDLQQGDIWEDCDGNKRIVVDLPTDDSVTTYILNEPMLQIASRTHSYSKGRKDIFHKKVN